MTNFIFVISREESMREILTVREREETRKKELRFEIDSAKRRLYNVIESNAASEKKLFDIWYMQG